MAQQEKALHAVTMERDRIVRVVRAPHVLGRTTEDYRVWAELLTYAWGECYGGRSELVIFFAGSDMEGIRNRLEDDGLGNFEAFDSIEAVDFDQFNRIVAGQSL